MNWFDLPTLRALSQGPECWANGGVIHSRLQGSVVSDVWPVSALVGVDHLIQERIVVDWAAFRSQASVDISSAAFGGSAVKLAGGQAVKSVPGGP